MQGKKPVSYYCAALGYPGQEVRLGAQICVCVGGIDASLCWTELGMRVAGGLGDERSRVLEARSRIKPRWGFTMTRTMVGSWYMHCMGRLLSVP